MQNDLQHRKKVFPFLITLRQRTRTTLMERLLHKKRKGDPNMESMNLTPAQQEAPLTLGHQPDGSYVFECRWCQKIEVLSPAEVQWYLERNFAMPSRCAPCRRKRRGIHRNYAARQETI